MMGWRRVKLSKGFSRRFLEVPSVNLFYALDRQNVVHTVAQGNFRSNFNAVNLLDRQGDGHGEQGAVAKAHGIQNALEIRLIHKAAQWRKGAHCQQFQIALHTWADLNRL